MAAIANLSVPSLEHLGGINLPQVDQWRRLRHVRVIDGESSSFCSMSFRRRRIGLIPCKAFRSEDGKGSGKGDGCESDSEEKNYVLASKSKRKGALYSLKSLLVRISGVKSPPGGPYRKVVEKAEEIFFSVSTHLGRYLLTMMSTGVILAIGFQLSGGDAEMNTLIWYSWLGGIIIGTMIGANIVLEEFCKAGPRNVVITGSTRGLGKALAREFLLSGDRVVVASRSPESVQSTVEELNENLKEGMSVTGSKRSAKLSRAKVVGIVCDVCKPDEVRNLANFVVNELGSVDIWINNAGTNKGFRPLLQFTDEDINQGGAKKNAYCFVALELIFRFIFN